MKSENGSKQSSNTQAAELRLIQKPLSLAEVVGIASELQSFVGAQLQDCLQTTSELGLALYQQGKLIWLWFDLQPLRPLVVRILSEKPLPRKKIKRPLTLFLRSRFLGRRLSTIQADIQRGRILLFSFHRSESENSSAPIYLEVRLFPHGQNVLAIDGEVSISEFRPKELPAQVLESDDQLPPRPWIEIEESWRRIQNEGARGMAASVRDAESIERDWNKQIAKKSMALEKMRAELEKKIQTPFSELGEWLKIHRTLALEVSAPLDWQNLIDKKKSLAWNIENCFRRAKENVRKAEGSRARIAQVELELNKLQSDGPHRILDSKIEAKDSSKATSKQSAHLLVRADASGRRMNLASDLDVYIGKSAADNLAILRRAQPFDYWLHIRERPGSHAILRRVRSRTVSDSEFLQAGIWVVEQTLKKRASELKGEAFDLLIVECRFVRPIKGDKLGRVHYSNDRVMRIRF